MVRDMHTQELEPVDPLHCCPADEKTDLSSLSFPFAKSIVISFVLLNIENKVVVLAPLNWIDNILLYSLLQLLHHLPNVGGIFNKFKMTLQLFLVIKSRVWNEQKHKVNGLSMKP